jgi:CBS-domain-containing membrane protein
MTLEICRAADLMIPVEKYPSLSSDSIQEVSRDQGFSIRPDSGLTELSWDHQLAPMKSRSGRPVRDVMLPIRVTVEEGDHLFKIIDEMVSQNVSLIPVLSDGRVTGAVRSVDVLREISRLILAD